MGALRRPVMMNARPYIAQMNAVIQPGSLS